MESVVDILGQTIREGDYVVYPQASGRSVQTVLGRVIRITEKAVSIQKLEGARWTPAYSRTRYVDSRTGKGIDIYAGDYKHYKIKPRTVYTSKFTGVEISEKEFRDLIESVQWTNYQKRQKIYSEWQYRYEPGELHDYVVTEKVPSKPVTITNVSNLVKVDWSPDQNVSDE